MKKPTLVKPSLSSLALEFSKVEKTPSEKRAFNAPEGHKRLTINLPEDLHRRLRQAALDGDCNATDIIVRLLTEKLS